MNLKHLLIAAGVLLGAGQAHAEGFTDDWIGVRDGMFVANPGAAPRSARSVNKVVFEYGHFNTWEYGSNFIHGDVLLSDGNEPSNNSGAGSTEFYGIYRGQLSPDKIFGINTKIGPFSAINFEFGLDLEAENTTFAPAKKLLVIGPNFHIDLPDYGFVSIGIHASKEWNNNGIASCTGACQSTGIPNFSHGGAVSFDVTPEFEVVWLYHMSWTGLPLDFSGFMNIVLPKGRNGFGQRTATEVLAVPRLSLDLGKMMGKTPHKFDLYAQVEFWENKFGNDHTLRGNTGMEEVSPQIGIAYHF
jgi:nucleoside-specific outer membrane channel protein Tsx